MSALLRALNFLSSSNQINEIIGNGSTVFTLPFRDSIDTGTNSLTSEVISISAGCIRHRFFEATSFLLANTISCIQPQKRIITYSLSANRQNIFAGAVHDAIFNTWRRFSKQVLYFAPPFLVAYYAMDWANKRYVTSQKNPHRTQ
ncbi:cytochrome b-c1 complex subunit 8 [Hypoxylon trugodes]|uniref:cytochrome b-c1 complex subunit 8 n=1 Tax=Hypoxylon trugodes TaxID=326681 RepID=UPI002194FA0B|nr:cytochrome b-c1 complex subunit 8 [Hypoxylon trugodes]KAI1387834.1 cytochrome b-c1 complex subunit 8 [Hypoxylon trugodes]